jgi:hypothetical protein
MRAARQERASLSTVMFDVGELWSEATGRRERVLLDLWRAILSFRDTASEAGARQRAMRGL